MTLSMEEKPKNMRTRKPPNQEKKEIENQAAVSSAASLSAAALCSASIAPATPSTAADSRGPPPRRPSSPPPPFPAPPPRTRAPLAASGLARAPRTPQAGGLLGRPRGDAGRIRLPSRSDETGRDERDSIKKAKSVLFRPLECLPIQRNSGFSLFKRPAPRGPRPRP